MILHETLEEAEPSGRAEQAMVSMRDGIRLATDVYLPDDTTPTEAILVRTPYDKTSRYAGLIRSGDFLNERGYVLVAQDCRGKFRSEGVTEPYATDVHDAYDTVEWITQQPWSNGVVGLLGPSYLGYTVWAGIASGHAAIRAAIPQATGLDMANMHVGSHWRLTPPNLLGLHDLVQIWTDPRSYVIDLAYGDPPFEMARDAEKVLGPSIGTARLLKHAGAHGWVNPYAESYPRTTAAIPILHWIEWFDPTLAPLGISDYKSFRRNPGIAHLHYLRANSADHGGFLLGDVPKGPHNDPNVNDDAYDRRLEREVADAAAFFDEHLRGGKGTPDHQRARWHIGHSRWTSGSDWVAEGEPRRFYLTASRNGGGQLGIADEAPTTGVQAKWPHDPGKPVPSSTSIDEIWTYLESYPDMSALRERDDVLSFCSEPLRADYLVAGELRLSLNVSSSAPSTHVFVKLLDRHADGGATPISRGEVVVHSHSYGRRVRVPLQDIAYLFRAGHALEIQLASSDYPYYIAHPGTDENPWFASNTKPSHQSVALGGTDGAVLEVRSVATAAEAGNDRLRNG